MDCSFVNEGCHGGWGYLDGIYLEYFGAVEDSCARYQASIDPEGCGKWADCPIVAKVKNTRYLGGHYGAMSEEYMIKELRARGPILLDFNAGPSFQAYKRGVLTDSQPLNAGRATTMAQTYSDVFNYDMAMESNTNNQTLEGLGYQWAKLTHSTLLIGYGVDEPTGMKYWLIRNSYGPNWGEGGNLRLRRGQNDYACETENISFDPILL